MAAIDGQFKNELQLEPGCENVEVGGPLTITDGLDLKLRVVVVDAEGNQADGEGTRDGAKKWKGIAAVRSGSPLKAGKAIAYGSAVGADDKGITTYQWHTIVTLLEPAP